METVCGRSASRSGRGGVRSGRAVVGLDVVSHTLPRNYRTKTYHHHHPPPPPAPPCCPSPHDPCHDQGLPDPTCAHCQPDLCPGDPSLRCAQVKPYPSHGYPPQVVTSGWENVGVAGECATCRGMVAPPLSCACSDPCCLGSYATTPVWDPASHHDQRQALAPHHDLQVVRASSVCVLPQVRSVEERLTSALGHALDPQNRAHTHDNIYTHSNAHGKTHAAATSSTTISHSNASTQPKTHHSAPQIHHLQPTGPRYPPSEIEAQQPQCTTTETYVHSHQSSPHVHSMTTRAFVHVRGNDEDHWNEKRSRLSHTHRPNTYTADLQKNQGQGPGAPAGSRLSRSVENLPRDIQEHILKCQCSCDHLGYGNYSAPSLHHLPGVTSKGSSQDGGNSREDLPVQEVTELKNKHKGGVEVPAHVWGGVCLVLVLAGVGGVGVSVPLALRVEPGAGQQERLATATVLLKDTPLVDGHNDLPWNIRKFMHNKLHSFNFTAELKKLRPWSRSSWSHTDLPRLKEGMVGAQFWVSYVPCQAQRLNAVQLTIEQIDLIKRLIDQYPDDLRLATSADEVEAAFKDGRIASLIGVEGGHAIQNSLGVLRALRDLGVRYLTLTHTCSTPWAECARAQETDLEDPLSPRGLTHFGKTVVREMNRLGLLVDLSHVSQATMQATLEVSRAPVIFSHSSVYAICRNPRNVPDHILRKVAMNGGIVMVSFYNHFLTCSEQATIKDVANHINHVRKIAGIQHVGIGADFDGVNKLPEGLEDVSKYPNLFAELLADSSWSLEDLKLLAGQNLLRVMREAEKVRLAMSRQKVAPYEEEVPTSQLENLTTCSYKFTKDPDDS